MENENKERINLTDEELKEVTGGCVSDDVILCGKITTEKDCNKQLNCKWVYNECQPKINSRAL